uniref:(northern house mosquito) hypothetical protein n=1 Tax=Culex pipiens TaxID=7175 RepID=A0A8D8BGM4_CULPI
MIFCEILLIFVNLDAYIFDTSNLLEYFFYCVRPLKMIFQVHKLGRRRQREWNEKKEIPKIAMHRPARERDPRKNRKRSSLICSTYLNKTRSPRRREDQTSHS